MANFKNARIGEMIDDVICPRCNQIELKMVGLSLENEFTPLVLQCQNCYADFNTNNDKYGLLKNECVSVKICYGYGIVFSVELMAEIGVDDSILKEKAIDHFKKYMPDREQIDNVETLLANKRASIEVQHEFN